MSGSYYLSEGCFHLSCQISNTQKCDAKMQRIYKRDHSTFYPVVGCVLIATCSKKMISPIESYQTL